MRVLLLMAATSALCAQPPIDPAGVLVRARNALAERDKHLPDYTCVQTVDRFYFERPLKHYPPPTCDEIRAHGSRGLMLESHDRLRLEIKVSHGIEIGSWKGSRFTSRDIFDLVGGGPYGTGTLGAFISDVFINGGTTYQYLGQQILGGSQALAYNFQVPLSASHYLVRSDPGWTAIPFSGSFWLDRDSLDLRRITEHAIGLPPETDACEADTTVDYQVMQVGSGAFLLPRRSTLHLVMQNETQTESTAVYTGCHEYHAESTIRFDVASSGAESKPAAAHLAPLPEGLRLILVLTAPIDTRTAAAGDILRAKIRKPVRDPKTKAILIPAGASVQGRIVQMRHWLTRPQRFVISILLEKVDIGGVSRPLYARLYREYRSANIILPPPGRSPLVGVFPLPTENSYYRISRGYESDWVTVAPPSPQRRVGASNP